MDLGGIMQGFFLKGIKIMDKIIITGATGFIGSHIVREFCKHRLAIGCLVRKESSLSNIEDLNIELRYGDITDKQSLMNAFKMSNFVIHNAAYVRDWGEYETFYRTNVEGTLNVLAACVENNIKDIIITGTNSVYGEESSKRIKDEDSPYNSHYPYFMDRIFPCKLNYYRDTKAIATKEAMRFAMERELNLTVLDPVWVYGEREINTGFFKYLKSVKNGMIFAPGSKNNKFHVIYVEDLARAYFLVYEKRLKGVNKIIIGNKNAELMDNIYALFCKEAGLKKPRLLSKWLVYPVGFIMELTATICQAKEPPLLTRGRVDIFYDNIEYSTEKAQNLLGFRNRYTLEEGIKKTVKWYKENNLI